MKKRIFTTIMVLLLSAAMLAGCGDSGSSRSSRDRYEDDEDDDDDRRSSRDKYDEDDDDDDRKSSRNKYDEDDEDDDEDDDRWSSKDSKSSSSSKKKDYKNDAEAFYQMCKDLDEVLDNAYDFDDLADGMDDVVNNLKITTSEGKKVKSDMQDIVKIYQQAAKYVNRGDEDKIEDLEDDLEDILEDAEDHMEAFLDAAYAKGVDYSYLDDLADYFEDIVLN